MLPLSPLDNFLLPRWCPLPPPQPPAFALFDSTQHIVPPSPSDTSSTDTPPSPAPDTVRVVCNVPLLAPRPLPYHSPTFLQFDLPDTDEDLSHPPYTHRPSKRKRDLDDDPAVSQPQPKRRSGAHRWRSRPVHRPWDLPSSPGSRPSGNHRSRA